MGVWGGGGTLQSSMFSFSNMPGGISVSALGLLANLKETREVKRACRVEATSVTAVVKGVMVVIPK
jgi:hypothetical protein